MSLNDPRWGNQGNDNKPGGNQGPPDLEELWRDVNRRLTGLFGRKPGPGRGGSGGEMPPLTPRQFGGGIGALLVLAVVVWLASGFYIVDASQRGVVLRFGRYVETTDPGLRWRLPYPVESHEVVNLTGVRTVEIGYRGSERNKVLREALMLTDDENIINIQFAVQYILSSPEKYLFSDRSPDETVLQAAETAMREMVGKNKMDFVLYEGREQIATTAQQLMQQVLDRYETGIQISKVTMQNAQPPEQVQAAFDDAVKAGQDRERQKNEGQAYANDVIPKARGTASRLLQEAEGYRARVESAAAGEASRFKQVLAEYSKAPEVTRSRLYLDTVQQVLSSTTKVMVDARSNGNLLFLPLDKLLASSSAPVAAEEIPSATGAATPPTVVAPPRQEPTLDLRNRDAGRNRERGDR
ncbi:MAG: FtsH protease activity modulator HflK [Rhodocyclaceae bacterium]|jgi:membrane protease subunit HflK|nr:FtsH protease activity modulator HflK [Rhodocyclaceae bacterium]